MASGGISSLLDISGRALASQGQVIRTISNNIANVNTPGYSRRQATLTTVDPGNVSGLQFGNGVTVSTVDRIRDQFINRQLEVQIGERARAEAESEFTSRAELPFNVANNPNNIGDSLAEFYNSLDDLATNPSSIPLRSAVLNAGHNLADAIQSSYNQLADLQRQADDRLRIGVDEVNTLAQKIADINQQILGTENGIQQNLTLRDSRDQLLRELSEKVSFQSVEQTGGAINITLANGFGLVTAGSARAIEYSTNPSFAPVGGFPDGLDGAPLGFVVFDFDTSGVTPSHVNLNDTIAAGGGELAGLLSFRGIQANTDTTPFDAVGSVVDLATRVEAIGRDLVTRFNQIYVGNDEDAGTAGWQHSSTNLNDVALNSSSTPTFGLFTFETTAATTATDTTGTVGLADSSDVTASLATLSISSVARYLKFNVDDPEDFAAGRDLLLGTVNPGNIVARPGDATNITGSTADTTLGRSAYLGLRDLRTATTTFTLGNLSVTATSDQLYQQTVSKAGSYANSAKTTLDVAKGQEQQVQELQTSISGVSLDQEFANLINFQRAFEAAARMVKVGDDLLGQIIGLLNG